MKIIESLSELGGQPAILYPEKMIYDIPAYPSLTGAELTENLIKQLSRFEDRTTICLKEEVLTFDKVRGGLRLGLIRQSIFQKPLSLLVEMALLHQEL